MGYSNQLVGMAREILVIEADLPYRLNYTKEERPTIDDFELYTFNQTWGSTALGFGGIGGQAMTQARTYVFVPVTCNQKCMVYFGGRFAYTADYCETLREDLRSRCMVSVAQSGRYRKREECISDNGLGN
jgi:hypothetical protein